MKSTQNINIYIYISSTDPLCRSSHTVKEWGQTPQPSFRGIFIQAVGCVQVYCQCYVLVTYLYATTRTYSIIPLWLNNEKQRGNFIPKTVTTLFFQLRLLKPHISFDKNISMAIQNSYKHFCLWMWSNNILYDLVCMKHMITNQIVFLYRKKDCRFSKELLHRQYGHAE